MLSAWTKSSVLTSLSLLFCIGATGCAHTKPAPADPHRRVGTITLVNEEARFVLIDGGVLPPASAGAALKCFSNGTETGVLTVSPERKPPFIIADIVKGAPHRGDEVFE